MSDTLHAPLPWTFCEFALEGPCQGKEPYRIRPLQYQIRALTLPLKSSHVAILAVRAEDKANARLIVRACNNHDGLLEALEDLKNDHLALLAAIGEQTGSNKMSHTFREALKHGALQKAEATIAKAKETSQ